jgi:predicted flap endonuclease-1-like 5' DNA nuclease
MPSEKTFVTVLCDNPFHKGPEDGPDFSYQPDEDAAATVVTRETARALLEEHEGYRCPELAEAVDDDPEETDGTALKDVKGIGKKTASDLEYAGVESVEALAEGDVENLAEKVGQSVGVVETWQGRAAELTASD